MLLQPSDFVGKYKIAKDSYTKVELEAYIEKYEDRYLQELMGCDLYDLFKADLTLSIPQIPQTTRFTELMDSLCIQDEYGEIFRSDGLLEMLKGFIFYQYVLDQKFRNTMVGTVVNETAFAREANIAKITIEDRYNLAVESYCAMQVHMTNATYYPEYNGINKRMSFFGGSF